MQWLQLLTAAAVLAQAPSPGAGPLGGVRVLQPEDGPTVVLRTYEAVPLVAIRLSVPITAPVSPGAIRAVQYAARQELLEAVERRGGRVRLARTPTRAIYTLTGPARGFMSFAGALRIAVGEPELTANRMSAVRTAVEAVMLAELDTPEPKLRRQLRTGVFGELPDGVGAVANELTTDDVRAAWRRFYRPERMRVIVVGPVPAAAVREGFQGWTAPPPAGDRARGGEAARLTPPEPRVETQAIIPRVGLAYPGAGIGSAVLAVVARLVHQRLDVSLLQTRRAELWWTRGDRRALVLIGSAEPADLRAYASASIELASAADSSGTPAGAADSRGEPASAADTGNLPASLDDSTAAAATARLLELAANGAAIIERQLRGALGKTLAQLSPTVVASARRALHREILFAARTPEGMASVLDRFMEPTGDAHTANVFLDALGRVGPAAVRAAIERLLAREPVVAKITP